jgi:dimethylaniline monooxygenase (N-oxide forming)
VTTIERDDEKRKWIVHTRDAATPDSISKAQQFNRLVVANGALNEPHMPNYEGIDKFAGEVLHSRQFKDPSKFTGKNVVLVGAGATSADSVSFLKSAKVGKIYFSHRGSFRLVYRSFP